jgi:hypothetical protein
MKRLAFIAGGSLVALAIVVAGAFLAGHFFGPLYEGEDEASRNFKIFLFTCLGSLVIGGIAGNRASSTKGE